MEARTCHCGTAINAEGFHELLATENAWGGHHFRRDDNGIEHFTEKPKDRGGPGLNPNPG
jgi:hypothetical protein